MLIYYNTVAIQRHSLIFADDVTLIPIVPVKIAVLSLLSIFKGFQIGLPHL